MNPSTYTSSPDYQFNHQKKKIFPHFLSSPCIPRDHHNRVIQPNSRWVEKIIRSSASRIKQLNAILIFATITPMSIQTWNKHRLHAHRTSHLNHFHHYQNMQDTIEEATLAIITTIHSINSSNKVITPKLAQEIIYKRHGHLRTRYGKLPDGVPPRGGYSLCDGWYICAAVLTPFFHFGRIEHDLFVVFFLIHQHQNDLLWY